MYIPATSVSGGQQLQAAVDKPKPTARLDGFAYATRAIGDLWDTLQDRQCHIVRNGEIFVGKARW